MNGLDGFVIGPAAPGECPAAAAHGPTRPRQWGEFQIAVAQAFFLHLLYNNCDGAQSASARRGDWFWPNGLAAAIMLARADAASPSMKRRADRRRNALG